jgi:hypothetical protein
VYILLIIFSKDLLKQFEFHFESNYCDEYQEKTDPWPEKIQQNTRSRASKASWRRRSCIYRIGSIRVDKGRNREIQRRRRIVVGRSVVRVRLKVRVEEGVRGILRIGIHNKRQSSKRVGRVAVRIVFSLRSGTGRVERTDG